MIFRRQPDMRRCFRETRFPDKDSIPRPMNRAVASGYRSYTTYTTHRTYFAATPSRFTIPARVQGTAWYALPIAAAGVTPPSP